MNNNLGKLNYIENLRGIWNNEASDFTPWLAENIDILGEALGIDIELISTEYGVGNFSLDIYAKEAGTDNYIAIENQLEPTNHSHLGQAITYASGIEAKTIIWICKKVREEHREAIDWLNSISDEEHQFFVLEIQLIQIDDSNPAPLFKIIASPNNWSKEQKTKKFENESISERRKYYKEFFTNLLDKIHLLMPNFTNSRSVSYDSWKTFGSGNSAFAYSVAFRANHRYSCELYIDHRNKEKNKSCFDMLYQHKEDIEKEIGSLSWERLDNRKACRIAVYVDETTEDELITWSIENLKAFKNVFSKYIKEL